MKIEDRPSVDNMSLAEIQEELRSIAGTLLNPNNPAGDRLRRQALWHRLDLLVAWRPLDIAPSTVAAPPDEPAPDERG